MAWPKRKTDPLSARARVLKREIAHVQDEIKRLDALLQRNPQTQPRLRSTALPHGNTLSHTPAAPPPAQATPAQEPIFEERRP